ncbi:hypothetical protein BH09VER1_BH09VER1_24340 [soil metagenome]
MVGGRKGRPKLLQSAIAIQLANGSLSVAFSGRDIAVLE